VPLRRWLRFAGKLTAEVGDFQRGSEYKVGKLADGHRFGVFICYEAVFPDLVRRFTANGAELLINLSNDGWFGRSAAPEQHLAMARIRAVENRRWLVRVTNNGYTVVVDPHGRYTARMEADARGAIAAGYGYRSDLTPYVRWGDWPAWMCVVVAVGLLAGNAAKGRTSPV
jgi:apolipoprotein N-acyltransferase